MSSHRRESEDLSSLESALADLQPREAGWNRDQLLFMAGQASAASAGKPTARGWPAAFAAMTAVAATLLVMLVLQPRPEMAAAPTERPAADAPPQAIDDGGSAPVDPEFQLRQADERTPNPNARGRDAAYLRLRDHVLAFGLDSWPTRAENRAGGDSDMKTAPNYRQLRNTWIEL